MYFVIIDDTAIHRELLVQRLQEVCSGLGMEYEIALSTEHEREVLDYAVNAPEGTVYLLDIELQDQNNGIDLRRQLHDIDPDRYIVYVSAYERYALECCQSHAFDFLLKPWTTAQLRECLRSIQADMSRRTEGTWLVVTMGSRMLRVRQEDIVYLSKEHNNVTIHLQSGDIIQQRSSFSAILKQLKVGRFLRCHKCYVVQLDAIQEYDWGQDWLVVSTGEVLPISRRQAGVIKAALADWGQRE